MKKALIYASVASMIQQFNMNNIILLQDMGYEVDVACNFELGSTISNDKIEQLKRNLMRINVKYFHLPIPRKVTMLKDLWLAYTQSKKLMNREGYDLIHCHSPIGGLICREANKHSCYYNHTKIIYTAHGFHFYKKNSPLKNFIFRNIEKHAARYTNILITINREDYEAAKKFKLKQYGKVKYIPGVGIDIDYINSVKGDKQSLCLELNISVTSILLLSVGELNTNKNHKIIIEALPKLPVDVHYLICGIGPLKDYYEKLAKNLGVTNRLHFLGYRNDVIRIMKSCDIFVFPSLREGLSVSLMEALACGMTCIASEIRGNNDLIISNENGFLISGTDSSSWVDRLCLCIKKDTIKIKQKDMKEFSTKDIEMRMKDIYKEE
ncbi:glycosyltransferase [[Clostridium] innocuum]|nr:glycosyltransferase [[Clostridium] innocuum]